MTNNASLTQDSIAAAILSGGAGSRFQGLDKGLQMLNDKTMVAHVIDAIKPQVNDIVLCINRNHQEYKRYDCALTFDAIDKLSAPQQSAPENQAYQGPLAGINAAIHYLSIMQAHDYLLVSSCDSPHLPSDYVSVLLSGLQEKNASSAVVHDGERRQNLHCLIHHSAWPSLQDFYRNGGRAMHRWHKKNGSVDVHFAKQATCFNNINSLAQLMESQKNP